MIQRVFSLFFIILAFEQMVFSEEVELTPEKERRIESDVIYTFETIIDLCKRERFDEIYEYGDRYSRERMSKEMFMSQHKRCGLASSWETVQDIEVEIISPTHVYVRAKLGFKGPRVYGITGRTEFQRRISEMRLEDGEWRIDLNHPLGVEERRQDQK